jgi:hypothetical protein
MEKEFATCASKESTMLVYAADIGDDIGIFILVTSHILSPFWQAKNRKSRLP